ncbi:MAG: hypothetical protein ACYTHM_12230 [Planctomycetota bacterium]|jgi:hypothetical protein
MKRLLFAFALLFLVGCAAPPTLPSVHGIAWEEGSAEKSTRIRVDVSELVDALASRSHEGSEHEREGPERPKRETRAQIISVLGGLLDAVFRNDHTSISAEPEKMELVVQGGASIQEKVKREIEKLKSQPDAPCEVRVHSIQFDPQHLESWNVLFYPFDRLKDGEGVGLTAVVSGVEFDKWHASAVKAGLLKDVTGPELLLKGLSCSKSFPACQVSFLSHYEEKAEGKLEPVMDSMAFGVSLALRGLRIASAKATALHFEAEITHAPGGWKVLTFKTARGWIHLPNGSRKNFAGTAKIPDGGYLVLMTGPFEQDCSPDHNPDWPLLIVIKPSGS